MTGKSAALLALAIATVWSQGPVAGDMVRGGAAATRSCGACHMVDQRSGTAQAPPFSAIAARPNIDRDKLALFLVLPHPEMPDARMTLGEAEDLANYILRGRPQKLPIELPVISNLPGIGN